MNFMNLREIEVSMIEQWEQAYLAQKEAIAGMKKDLQELEETFSDVRKILNQTQDALCRCGAEVKEEGLLCDNCIYWADK